MDIFDYMTLQSEWGVDSLAFAADAMTSYARLESFNRPLKTGTTREQLSPKPAATSITLARVMPCYYQPGDSLCCLNVLNSSASPH